MEVKEFIEKNFEQMKADLKSVVDINSEYSEDVKPFGSGPRKALDQALKLMEEKALRQPMSTTTAALEKLVRATSSLVSWHTSM